MQKTIIIGDIHGCLDELLALLDLCEVHPDDEVICVGDLIGRGPNPNGVLQWLKNSNARSVLGNHEGALIDWKQAMVDDYTPPPLGSSLKKTAMELTEESWSIISKLPLYIRLPEHNIIVVHAGLVPGISIDSQNRRLMLNIRTIKPDGTGSEKKSDGPLWASLWTGPEEIVFGHHASRGLQLYPNATGIDTGCVYGGSLTAYILPERTLKSVTAAKQYYPIRKPQ